MQPMAQRLGIDHQRLQQFISTSPWPVELVRKTLATKAINLIQPDAWVVDDTGFVKDGSASPGVARQYLRHTRAKVGNVQIRVVFCQLFIGQKSTEKPTTSAVIPAKRARRVNYP